jgi:hypothetical protein
MGRDQRGVAGEEFVEIPSLTPRVIPVVASLGSVAVDLRATELERVRAGY